MCCNFVHYFRFFNHLYMKKHFVFLLSLVFSTLAIAHEFWLMPVRWFAEVGQAVRVGLCVGENFTCEPWEAGISRVIRFSTFCGETETKRLDSLRHQGLGNLSLTFDQPGTHLVALATNNKYLEMEAEKFDAYLKEDGLEHIRHLRQKHGQTQMPSRELYRREAATLVQIGQTPTPIFWEKTGFDLQILPENNPLMSTKTEMTFQIRFKGKPLRRALVRHWHKTPDGKAVVQFKTTNRRGQVRFALSSGEQMISVIHMTEHINIAEADWQSIWGNLTFYGRDL